MVYSTDLFCDFIARVPRGPLRSIDAGSDLKRRDSTYVETRRRTATARPGNTNGTRSGGRTDPGSEEPWDLVVVGGGATGPGSGRRCRGRGYRTLLLEAARLRQGDVEPEHEADPRRGPLPGQGHVGLVREALHERDLLRRTPRTWSTTFPLSCPPIPGGKRRITAWAEGSMTCWPERAGPRPSRVVGDAEVLRRAPTLEPQGLRGGIVYDDGQFDDAGWPSRLLGPCSTRGGPRSTTRRSRPCSRTDGRISGVVARDTETGEELPSRPGP